MIGGQFGHGEDKNTAAQLVSHAILGATLAYINGGDPTAGGSAAVASEAAANYLTKQLEEKYKDDPKYFVNGEFQANLLSETEKAQIRDLTAGIGAVIGGAVGDSTYNAQLVGVIGQNAVENNEMSLPFPVNNERMQGIQSIIVYGNKNGWSNKQIQEVVAKESRGRDFQGEEYTKALVYSTIETPVSMLLPEVTFLKLRPLFGPLFKGAGATAKVDSTTVTLYRKMSESEAELALKSQQLISAKAGANNSKYLSEELGKLKNFSNKAVNSSTKEVVVEYKVEKLLMKN
ncbi:VENN motif pre-toxin domain-containing protein [Acinetobacter sp.]|uniref:VENN motif pre-toxin domain-containing protein n=1 Tax=Acinetobacter sp. TaxID=472 RepID=UPI002FC9FB0A